MAEVANEVRDQGKIGAQHTVLESFFALLTLIATARGFWILAFAAAVVIGPTMMPVAWSGNEIVYFDLAYRSVAPEAFTDHHAMFDGSNSRIVGLMAIGYVIKALGFETAKTVLAVLCWGLYALALGSVGRGLGLRVVDLAAALIVFLLARQELFGGEWIFGTIETKVLAYVCVLFGFAAALRERWTLVVLITATATYFHFLVGGTGAALLLLLFAMSRPGFWSVAKLIGSYIILVVPVLAILVSERMGVDASSLDVSADIIYATIRAPALVAPFANGRAVFVANWLPGLVMHASLSVLLYWLATERDRSSRTLLVWLALLNLLPVLAMAVAFLDRDTHLVAKFLIFRPSSIILLFSLLCLSRAVLQDAGRSSPALTGGALLLVLAIVFPDYALNTGRMIFQLPPATRLMSQMGDAERDVLQWISANAEEDAAILLQPKGPGLENSADAFTLGAERLSGRGMIVDFKNVPSHPGDFVRWYELLTARAAFFEGDCGQLATLSADYVVFRREEQLMLVASCTEPVYANDRYIVAHVR
jgi:hypothetical protein